MCQALERANIKGVVSAKEAQFARKEIVIYLAELRGKPFEKDTPLGKNVPHLNVSFLEL